MTPNSLDLRGQKCPLPALKTRKLLNSLKAGDELIVECTDPLAGIDIPNLLRQTGDELLSVQMLEEVTVFRIRKK